MYQTVCQRLRISISLPFLRCCDLVLIALVLAIAFSRLGNAQQQSAPPATVLLSNQAITLNPSNGKIYAVDEVQGAVSVINSATGAASLIKVGNGPEALAVNKNTGRVYVANSASGTISVIDGEKDLVIATISAGAHPYVLAVNEATNKIYVTHSFNDVVTEIDGATNSTTAMKLGSADNIIADSVSNHVFLLGYENPELTVLNGATHAVEKLSAGMHLWGMALDESLNILYATQTTGNDVLAINLKSREKKVIATGAIPCAVAINPKTHTVYVANYGNDSVTIISGRTHTAVAKVSVGAHPQALAIDPTANLIYVANAHSNNVTIIDGKNHRVAGTVQTGKNPYGIIVAPGGKKLYTANLGQPSFTEVEVPAGLSRY